LSEPPYQLLDSVVPGAPFAAFLATSFRFVKLTPPEPPTNAAMLDVPAGAPVPSTGASTSMSANVTGCDTLLTWSAATFPAGMLAGCTRDFVPVYVHAPVAGHVAPPNTATPASSAGDATATASAYVAAHAITR
jgi:hypothetical protein